MGVKNAIFIETGKNKTESVRLMPTSDGIEIMVITNVDEHPKSAQTVLTPGKAREFIHSLKIGKTTKMFCEDGGKIECSQTIFKEDKYVPGRRIQITDNAKSCVTLVNFKSLEKISDIVSGWLYFQKDLMSFEEINEENDLMLDEIILLQDRIADLEKIIAKNIVPRQKNVPIRAYNMA